MKSECKGECPQFDINYVFQVVADILNRRNDGYTYRFTVTGKKEPENKS